MRRALSLVLLAFAVPAQVTAQVSAKGPVTLPSGFARVPGPSGVEWRQPWGEPSTRFQFVDPGQVGAASRFSGLSLRRDNETGMPSAARQSTVTILMAHARSELSESFEENYADPPIVVFSRTVELPATASRQWSWGHILFIFDQPFFYDGERPLLIEFRCHDTEPAGRYSLDCVDGGSRGLGRVRYPEIGEPQELEAHVSAPVTDASGVVMARALAGGAPPRAPGYAVWSLPAGTAHPLAGQDMGIRPARVVHATGLLADAEGVFRAPEAPLARVANTTELMLQFVALDPGAPLGFTRSDVVWLELASPAVGYDSSVVYSLESSEAKIGHLARDLVPIILLATR